MDRTHSVSPATLAEHRPEIVLVDDAPSHLRLMECLLSSPNHEIRTFGGPREVLEHLKTHTPDLLVLDIDMPGLNGLDLANRIKMVPRLARVPVVLVTSLRDRRVHDERAFVGAAEVLEKPLRGERFRATVDRYLDRPLGAPRDAAEPTTREPGAARPR